MLFVASAPAKLILSGEHAVVYSYKSLASSISLFTTTILIPSSSHAVVLPIPPNEKIDNAIKTALTLIPQHDMNFIIKVITSVPIGSGIGSSASFCVSLCAALASRSGINNLDEINEFAFKVECAMNGPVSGLDNTVSCRGGFLTYDRTELKNIQVRVCVNCEGIPKDTGKQVAAVKQLRDRYPQLVDSIFASMQHNTLEILNALQRQDIVALQELFDVGHSLLTAINVSHPVIDQVKLYLKSVGISGCKITGAGGGGCMICVLDGPFPEVVKTTLREGWNVDVLHSEIGGRGVLFGAVDESIAIDQGYSASVLRKHEWKGDANFESWLARVL